MLTQRMQGLEITHNTRAPLDPSFNAAVWRMAYKFNPDGWDVSANAPTTLADLVRTMHDTGRLVVDSVSSARTIYDRPATNYAFRAWHDACHLLLAAQGDYAEFDLKGETAVMKLQQAQLIEEYGYAASAYWRRILEAEIVGQIAYFNRVGAFPDDQYACDVEYMEQHK